SGNLSQVVSPGQLAASGNAMVVQQKINQIAQQQANAANVLGPPNNNFPPGIYGYGNSSGGNNLPNNARGSTGSNVLPNNTNVVQSQNKGRQFLTGGSASGLAGIL